MKHRYVKYLAVFALLVSTASCKKYLDINTDPDTPQTPDPSSVMPAMLANIPRGIQFDARYLARYVQNWGLNTANDVWDTHGFQGFPTATDVSGDIWRQTYYGLGANLNYIIEEGKTKGMWDYVGAAYALKALMFQQCTDTYGDIIYTEAFKENTAVFRYDDQEVVYEGVDSLCREALYYLGRTDLSPTNQTLAKGDYVYDGNRTKWTRFVNGLLARNFMRYSRKPEFNPDSVIYYADRSFTSINDDFLVPFDATKNDDTNFFGTFRNNLASFRQTTLIVGLLDGTILAGAQTGANRDPRIRHMLSASPDTTNGNGGYRSVVPGAGDPQNSNATSRTRVANPWGDSLFANPSASRFEPNRGKYLFRDKVVSPVMTYSEILFLKAEAAIRKTDLGTAHAAYIAGINAHFDFINRGTFPRGNTPLFNNTTISAAERAAYLASANVKTAGTITRSDIMLQKYIAQYGWNFVEQWVDLRRYNYTDLDPATGQPVFRGYVVPSNLNAANMGKLAQRIRPRYNSEYVWNRPELDRIGATAPDYHTKPMWFSLP
ncbi:MAG TPA: SusD/RagB family nutrient-binding outer membrane lipoprotein [Flavisolibacter sp.]|nr:SusD/RagB family nutrient-binding outer membrane lipoprotein [Flavisolibacter sp.]